MRRGISDDKAKKAALIAQLAAAKKQKEQQDNGPRPNRPIIGLSDSSDEDEYASSDTENSRNTSDLDEDDIPKFTSTAVPNFSTANPSFNRLRKQDSGRTTSSLPSNFSRSGSNVTSASAADSLVNDMQGLNVGGGGGGVHHPSNNIKSFARQPSAASQSSIPISTTTATDNTKPSSSQLNTKLNTNIIREKEKINDGDLDFDDGIDAENEDDSMCLILKDSSRPANQQFRLSPKLSATLYPHQIEGVTWLYGLWKVGAGGILADDMGLGKTMQTSAFLSGLLTNRLARRALILAPTTLIATWDKELSHCGLGSLTHQYYGTPAERERALRRVVGPMGRGVVLATYGMVLHNAELLAQHAQHDPDDGPLWDLIIMDEGHKLKNPKMQLRARVEMLPVRQRLILSGTPIQNNLMEMHALFDLVCPGLLGDSKSFKDHYEKKITAGNDKHATVGERERGAATAAALRSAIAPHMLRREKKDVFGDDKEKSMNSSHLQPGDNNKGDRSTGEASTSTTSNTAAGIDPGPLSNASTMNAVISDSTASDTTTTTSTITGAVPGSMPRKNDFVVWLRLKPNQRALYESFLNSDSVRQVLNRTKSALASLTVLKKICDHPALLSEKAAEGIISGAERAARKAQGLDHDESKDNDGFIKKKNKKLGNDLDDFSASSDSEEEDDEEEEELEEGEYRSPSSKNKVSGATAPIAAGNSNITATTAGGGDINGSDYDAWVGSGLEHKLLDDLHKTGLEASCKTVFVLNLLRNLVAHGHRTLVFSQSRVMLDILEAAVGAEGWRICRIDGTVSAQERANRVHTFQTSSDIPIFLLTSQVGGLGLTLTAADRVIVVDPAWNPSVDSQSVDRAYRIGQKRDVVVYRLISCGTVEDKIYRKQVFKGGLSRTGMQDGEQFRYFSAAELRDMFRLDPVEAVESSTQKQLHALHAKQRQSTPELEEHLKFLTSVEGFSGISDHDLLYSVKEVEGNGAPEMGSAAAGVPIAAEYQPGFAAPSPLRKPRGAASGAGGGLGGGGSQEWSGGGDISSMFGKMLSLGNSTSGGGMQNKPGLPSYEASVAAVAAAGAASSAAAGPPIVISTSQSGGRISPSFQRNRSYSAVDAQQKQIDSLKLQLEKQQGLLLNPVLVAGLADGGAKIRGRVEQLRQEIVKLGGVEEEEYEEGLLQEEIYLPAVGAAAVPPPPPPPTAVLQQDSDSTVAYQQLRQQPHVSDTNQDAVKELKRVLYQRAKELAAAEASGNTSTAAALRQHVEQLNYEYELAKEKEASRSVVII